VNDDRCHAVGFVAESFGREVPGGQYIVHEVDPRESYQTTQIVIVTPESAVSKTFDGVLDRLIGL
jgi:hypothetical protein